MSRFLFCSGQSVKDRGFTMTAQEVRVVKAALGEAGSRIEWRGPDGVQEPPELDPYVTSIANAESVFRDVHEKSKVDMRHDFVRAISDLMFERDRVAHAKQVDMVKLSMIDAKLELARGGDFRWMREGS